MLFIGTPHGIYVPWATASASQFLQYIYVTLPEAFNSFVILKWSGVTNHNSEGVLYYNPSDSINYGMGSMTSGYTSYSISAVNDNVLTLYASRSFAPNSSGTMYCLYE